MLFERGGDLDPHTPRRRTERKPLLHEVVLFCKSQPGSIFPLKCGQLPCDLSQNGMALPTLRDNVFELLLDANFCHDIGKALQVLVRGPGCGLLPCHEPAGIDDLDAGSAVAVRCAITPIAAADIALLPTSRTLTQWVPNLATMATMTQAIP